MSEHKTDSEGTKRAAKETEAWHPDAAVLSALADGEAAEASPWVPRSGP